MLYKWFELADVTLSSECWESARLPTPRNIRVLGSINRPLSAQNHLKAGLVIYRDAKFLLISILVAWKHSLLSTAPWGRIRGGPHRNELCTLASAGVC